MYGSEAPEADSGGPGGGSGGPGAGSDVGPQGPSATPPFTGQTIRMTPMLELWTARFSSHGLLQGRA